MTTFEDELYRKALDQMAFLLSSYENDRISGETLKSGVETIWNTVSGLIRNPGFNDLMKEANAFLREVPTESRIKVFKRDDRLCVVSRQDETVTVYHASLSTPPSTSKTFLVSQAVDAVKTVSESLAKKGFEQI